MKRVLWFLSLLVTLGDSIQAAPFQNLGFDDANTNNASGSGNLTGTPADLLPGWKIFSGNHPLKNVNVDFVPSGDDYAILYSTNIYLALGFPPPPVDGRFSLTLIPLFDVDQSQSIPYTLEQTGDIPAGASVIHFLGFWSGRLELTLNGSAIPLVYVPRPSGVVPEFDVYGDISAFAGQTVDLKFTTMITSQPFLFYGLDSIRLAARRK
jgi:hypothetical protein